MTRFQDWRDLHKLRVEQVMNDFVDRQITQDGRFSDAVRYAVQSDGKRIRPLLAYAAAEAAGVNLSVADYPAVAIELVHTYSLIHDDLPAMDDDDLRRGQPTLHRAFDEGMAILVGDALLTQGLHFLTEAPVEANLRIDWVKHLAGAAGMSGMVQGQATDLEGSKRLLALDELEVMHRRKTGALIEASLTMVANSVNDANLIEQLRLFADHIGLAFQIRDDILDVEGSTDALGKPSGSDITNKKSTFVSLLGLEESKRRLLMELDQAHSALDAIKTASRLRSLADYIVNRSS